MALCRSRHIWYMPMIIEESVMEAYMTKVPREFADFLRTGVLGRLDPSIYTHPVQVRELLGTPDVDEDVPLGDGMTRQRLVFDRLVIYFFNYELQFVQISFRLWRKKGRNVPELLRAPWLVHLRGARASTIKAFLRAEHIEALRVTFDHLDIDEDEGLSELLEIRPTKTFLLFDEEGQLEEITYDPKNPGRFMYEALW